MSSSITTQKLVRKVKLTVVSDNPRHSHDFINTFLYMQKEIIQNKEEQGNLITIEFDRNLANINNASRVAKFQIQLYKVLYFENFLKHIKHFNDMDLIVICMPAPRLQSHIHNIRLCVLEIIQKCIEYQLNCQELFEKIFFLFDLERYKWGETFEKHWRDQNAYLQLILERLELFNNFKFMEHWFNYYSHCDNGVWRYACFKNMITTLASHCREITVLQAFFFVGVMFAENDWHMGEVQRNQYKQLAPGHMERAMIKKRIAQDKKALLLKKEQEEQEANEEDEEVLNQLAEQKQQKLLYRRKMLKLLKKLKIKIIKQKNDAEIMEKAQQKAKKQGTKDSMKLEQKSSE